MLSCLGQENTSPKSRPARPAAFIRLARFRPSRRAACPDTPTEMNGRGWRILWSLVLGHGSFLVTGLGAAPANDPTLQTDANWIDARWQKADVGQFLCACIETPRQKTYKAIAIKVGDSPEATVCFDTDLLRYSAGWTGGFLEMNPRRYGLIEAPKPRGDIQFSSVPGPGWAHEGNFLDPRPQSYGP